MPASFVLIAWRSNPDALPQYPTARISWAPLMRTLLRLGSSMSQRWHTKPLSVSMVRPLPQRSRVD